MVRAPKFESAKQISGIEDISLVLAVLLLAVTAVCVLFGTLYPLVHEALGKGSLSVGAPYFNSIFAPMAILAALMIGSVQMRNSPVSYTHLDVYKRQAEKVKIKFQAPSHLISTIAAISAAWLFLIIPVPKPRFL